MVIVRNMRKSGKPAAGRGLRISQIIPVIYKVRHKSWRFGVDSSYGWETVMRFGIFSNSLRATVVASLALTLGAGSALAQAAPDSSEREEIIITHHPLGPLSEWAQ